MTNTSAIKAASESLAAIRGISYDEAWEAIMLATMDFDAVMEGFGCENVKNIEIN